MRESEGGNQEALKILEAELTRLCGSTREAWRHFFTWFTWSLGTQALVLGWIMTKKADELPPAPKLIVLAAALVVFNILGLLAARRIGSFAASQGQRADTICRAMMDRAEASGLNVNITPPFSAQFMTSAAWQCAGALATAGVVWLFLLLERAPWRG